MLHNFSDVLVIIGLTMLAGVGLWTAISSIISIVRRERAMIAKMNACSVATVQGPHPGGTIQVWLATNTIAHIHLLPIPLGAYAMINVMTGEINYSFPTDTNRKMDTNFSLDELEEAREFINSGRKLH
jgi:hypothetical protein